MEARDIVRKPVITEESYTQAENNKYTFVVDKRANKTQVKNAVEEIFEVTVEKVNIMNVKPRPRRVGRYSGFINGFKKAIVTVQQGQEITDFFA